MKITTTSDWRADLPFDVPVLVADVVPGEPTRCVGCPADTPLHARTDLWAVKHAHPNNPAGFVRFYCLDHRPAPRPQPVVAVAASRSPRERSATRVAKPTVPERPRAVCPNCFMEVPPTGVCGNCGEQVG